MFTQIPETYGDILMRYNCLIGHSHWEKKTVPAFMIKFEMKIDDSKPVRKLKFEKTWPRIINLETKGYYLFLSQTPNSVNVRMDNLENLPLT